MKTAARLVLHCLLFAFISSVGRAAPGDLDLTYNPNPSLPIRGMALQADGKILMAGSFTNIAGVGRYGVARLNPDGTADPLFNPGTNGTGDSVAVQLDQKIIIGGDFTSAAGFTNNYIARVTPDGVDDQYNATANDVIHSIALQPDGKTIVGGTYTTVGQTLVRLHRLAVTGARESGFAGNGPNNYVYAIALQPDGKIVIGGYFTTFAGVARNRFARLNADGSLDTAFTTAPNDPVRCVAIQKDGKILIGGTFTTIGGITRPRLARLHADGALDTTFTPGMSTGGFDEVRSMTIQADGKIIIAGRFTTIGGLPRQGVAKLHADGSVDTDFSIRLLQNSSQDVNAIAVQKDGMIVLSGDYSQVNGVNRRYLARVFNSPATESLTVPSANRVQWLRGGASPETHFVAFDVSINGGSSWTSLGVGTRIAGGWELTGPAIPQRCLVRARALIPSGLYNGSSGWVESVASVGTETVPPLLTSPASNAVSGNPVQVSFSLPANALPGSVKLTFSDGITPRVLTLASSQESSGAHSFSFDPANPLGTSAISSGSPVPNGVYSVSLAYQDASGFPAASSSVATSFKIDTTPPTLSVPAPIVAEATASLGARVNFTVTRSDSFDPAPSLVVSPSSGSIFPLGTTTVTASSTDWAGNTRTATFLVTVHDTTPPGITGPFAPLVLFTGPGGTTALPDYLAQAKAADAVGVTSVSQDPPAGSMHTVGSATVTISAEDAAGNIGTTTFDVSIADGTPPTIAAPPAGFTPASVIADLNGTAALPGYMLQAVTADNVAVTSVAQVPAPGTFLPFGKTLVTLTASDAAGNTQDIQFEVIVRLNAPLVKALASVGGLVPGAGVDPRIAADATFKTVGIPAVADNRGVAFRGTWRGSSAMESGIFAGTSPVLLVKTGEDAPGVAGARFKLIQDPLLSPGGAVAFRGRIQGPGINSSNNEGVWMHTAGTPALALRKGMSLPGIPPRLRLHSFKGLSLRDGELLAHVALAPSGTTTTSPGASALVRVTASGPAVLLRQGAALDLADGFPPSAIEKLTTLVPGLASPGVGRWHADGAALALVTLRNERTAILEFSGDGSVRRSLATGDGIPNLPPSVLWNSVRGPAIAPIGQGAVARGTLIGTTLLGLPPLVFPRNDVILGFSQDAHSPFLMFAREGAPAPGAANAVFADFLDPLVNDLGRVAFSASLAGTGISEANKQGIWWGQPNSLSLLARANAPVGAIEGVPAKARWSRFDSLVLPSGPDAGPLLIAQIRGTGVSPQNHRGVWGVDTNGALRPLLRTGDLIDGNRVIGFQTFSAPPGALGSSRGYNARGTVAARVTFPRGGGAIVRIDIPDGATRLPAEN